MTFGERLRELRKDAGLSQSELAEKSNLNRNSIYRYENDKAMPRKPQLSALLKALEVPADALMSTDEMRREGLIQTGDEMQATKSLYLAYGFKMEKTEDGKYWVVTDADGHSTTLTVREWQDYTSNRVRDIKVFALYLHEKLMKDIKGDPHAQT